MVRCGDWNIADTTERYNHQDRNVMAITKHPLFVRGRSDNLRLYNDIALVHTKEAFDLGSVHVHYLSSSSMNVIHG